MTENKPIMIDGCDVSKCNYFNSTDECYCEECCSEFGCAICNDRPNCYFKQLARKTQECEELKERLNSRCFDPKSNNNRCINYNRIAEDYERDLKQIDQLKAENETYKKMLDNPEVRVALIDIRTGERDLWQKYKPRMEQAEQKLELIEEYCKEQNLKADYTACEILQIIDEEE